MFAFCYPAAFRPDENGRLAVSFAKFPHAHTDGKDVKESMEEAIDCLGSVIAHYIAEKMEIPAPSRPRRGQRMVSVPFWIVGKLALYLAMREKGINDIQLARRLAVSETVVAGCSTRTMTPNRRSYRQRSKRLENAWS